MAARKRDIYAKARTCIYSLNVTERGINFTKKECPKCRRIFNTKTKSHVYLVVAEKCDICEYHAVKLMQARHGRKKKTE